MQIIVPLNKNSDVPLYRQLTQGLQKMIQSGKLPANSKLPSSRELSESLGISRHTASLAYEELSRLGLILTKPMSGTFVCNIVPKNPVRHKAETAACLEVPLAGLSDYGKRITSSSTVEPADVELFAELNYCAPAPEQLPLAKWQEMLVKASKKLECHAYFSDVLGHEGLRRALADYLKRTRGLKYDYEHIAIFSGAQPALDLLSRILINEGQAAMVENPGFPGARRTFASYGAKVVPVPVDRDGVVMKELYQSPIKPQVLYLTPSHHDPFGFVLSQTRRKQLLHWAQTNGVWIIEDDFDSEYRYGEEPSPALQSLDDKQAVIYLSAFWKIMFPVLRVGFAVVPPRLLPVVRRAKSLVERDFHYVEHEALSRFISEGHMERHIRKTKRIYSRRREVLIRKLNQSLGPMIRISPVSAGTHLCVHFESMFSESQILEAASRATLPVVSTRAYYVVDPRPNEMLIPFAHIDEQRIEGSVAVFSELLRTGKSNV